ncbi:MerR family transcriptional regulator OS=Streptomyces alboniger OX=132473 GN=CP975_16230 PE=4 SV=1 [Streptomyces alboniger]
MFTIGDFARHGRVSVRMLRHYDATGLLRPAHVDPATGYRYYSAAQSPASTASSR